YGHTRGDVSGKRFRSRSAVDLCRLRSNVDHSFEARHPILQMLCSYPIRPEMRTFASLSESKVGTDFNEHSMLKKQVISASIKAMSFLVSLQYDTVVTLLSLPNAVIVFHGKIRSRYFADVFSMMAALASRWPTLSSKRGSKCKQSVTNKAAFQLAFFVRDVINWKILTTLKSVPIKNAYLLLNTAHGRTGRKKLGGRKENCPTFRDSARLVPKNFFRKNYFGQKISTKLTEFVPFFFLQTKIARLLVEYCPTAQKTGGGYRPPPAPPPERIERHNDKIRDREHGSRYASIYHHMLMCLSIFVSYVIVYVCLHTQEHRACTHAARKQQAYISLKNLDFKLSLPQDMEFSLTCYAMQHIYRKTSIVDHESQSFSIVRDFSVPTMSAIANNLDSVLNEEFVQRGSRYSCSFCKKSFKWRSHWKSHERIHTGERPFQCEICGKTFTRSDGLQCHRALHTSALYSCLPRGLPHECRRTAHHEVQSSLPVCRLCSKRCYSFAGLMKHMQKHKGGTDYKCEVCNKKFTKRSALDVHSRVHTGIKPYRCNICTKTFSIHGNLKRHLLIHSGERPYICLKCSKCFNNSSHLTRHIKAKHPSEEKRTSKSS
ncbi:zinc finger 664-like, partial [Paramuricea clavata]